VRTRTPRQALDGRHKTKTLHARCALSAPAPCAAAQHEPSHGRAPVRPLPVRCARTPCTHARTARKRKRIARAHTHSHARANHALVRLCARIRAAWPTSATRGWTARTACPVRARRRRRGRPLLSRLTRCARRTTRSRRFTTPSRTRAPAPSPPAGCARTHARTHARMHATCAHALPTARAR
jgi:hypothetical protein